jgi:hypothetical protein
MVSTWDWACTPAITTTDASARSIWFKQLKQGIDRQTVFALATSVSTGSHTSIGACTCFISATAHVMRIVAIEI